MVHKTNVYYAMLLYELIITIYIDAICNIDHMCRNQGDGPTDF